MEVGRSIVEVPLITPVFSVTQEVPGSAESGDWGDAGEE